MSIAWVIWALVSLFGALVLRVGIRGKRVGHNPHCGQCDYNLTGATSQCCPECGNPIDDRGVAIGTRKPRLVLMTFGAAILATVVTVGGYKSYKFTQSPERFRYYPFGWVLSSAKAGTQSALDELERRKLGKQLSSEQLQRIAPIALAEQGTPTFPVQTQTWVNLLEAVYQSGNLTDAQTAQYFSQSRTYNPLAIRDRVCEGEAVPIQVTYTNVGAETPCRPDDPLSRWTEVLITQDQITLRRVGEPDVIRGPDYVHINTSECVSQVGSPGTIESVLELLTLEPGDYELEIDVIENVNLPGVPGPVQSGERLFSRNIPLVGQFKVIPDAACETVELIDDPEMVETILDSLSVGPLEIEPSNASNDAVFARLSVHAGGGRTCSCLTVPVAFDVFLVVDDRELPFQSFVMRAGKYTKNNVNANIPPIDIASIGVVLRTSPMAARETVDIDKIWNGEITIDDVSVE